MPHLIDQNETLALESSGLEGVCILDRYEILKCLGRGGFATVFACRDRKLGNVLVAMKIFPHQTKMDPVGQVRLAREIRAAYRVQHDNVVRFYDLIQQESFTAITMEYVEGPKLRTLLNPAEPAEIPLIVDILRQLCAGLKAIHEVGIIHRDLKPENILIADNSLVKITDFGISALTLDEKHPQLDAAAPAEESSQAEDRRVTQAGQLLGTSEYISPEFIQNNVADFRSDIYALGVIAYELITCQYLFEYNSLEQLIECKIHNDPVAPHLLRADCPEELSAFCMKAIKRNPDERYHSAAECLQAIQKMLKNGEIPSYCKLSRDWRHSSLSAAIRRDDLGSEEPQISTFGLQVSGNHCAAAGERRSRSSLAISIAHSWHFRLLVLVGFCLLVVVIASRFFSLADFVETTSWERAVAQFQFMIGTSSAPKTTVAE